MRPSSLECKHPIKGEECNKDISSDILPKIIIRSSFIHTHPVMAIYNLYMQAGNLHPKPCPETYFPTYHLSQRIPCDVKTRFRCDIALGWYLQCLPSWELTYPPKRYFQRWFSFSPGGICDRSLEGRICVSLFRCPESPDINDLGKSVPSDPWRLYGSVSRSGKRTTWLGDPA